MAEHAVFRIPRAEPTAEQRKRQDQRHRRNLRIAIRQLERAELYLVALYSLELDDRAAEASVDDLIGRMRSLQRYLLQSKLTA
jgi:hypothetical protein